MDPRTRSEARRVSAQVVARERKGREGRIGLRSTDAGIGTDRLVLERDGLRRVADGAVQPYTTLADLARFAGVDLGAELSVGDDTPALGDPDAPLSLDPEALGDLLAFYRRAWSVLEPLAAGAPLTLWPEHFDAAYVHDDKANVGASPGDDWSAEPYYYVGPWSSDRPGDPAAWNAPFGAVISAAAPDEEIAAFVRDRLALLG